MINDAWNTNCSFEVLVMSKSTNFVLGMGNQFKYFHEDENLYDDDDKD